MYTYAYLYIYAYYVTYTCLPVALATSMTDH